MKSIKTGGQRTQPGTILEAASQVDHERYVTEPADERSRQVDELLERKISRAIGEELRRAREAHGWIRAELVALLPSGIGDRTLLSYEHGTRHLTVLRFLELCRALRVEAPVLLSRALQRAQLELSNLVLRVDLQVLLKDKSDKFRPMVQWARNKLNEYPDGVVDLPPSSVKELATFVGYSYRELACYLARFTPESGDYVESAGSGMRGQR